MTNAKRLRYERGLSAAEVALSVGVSAATVYNVERGDYQPTAPLAKRFADFYEVTVSEFLGVVPLKDAA